METRTLTLKGVPVWLYETLKQNAKSHHRSLNGEVIVGLETYVKASHRPAKDILEETRQLRKNIPDIGLNEKMLQKMINKGRA